MPPLKKGQGYGIYALYDAITEKEGTPAQRGGRTRIKYAIRDEQGRVMPTNEEAFENWKLDPNHGKAGAAARWSKKQS